MRVATLLAIAACGLAAQDFSQRGFLETRAVLYPETAPNDSAHFVNEWLFRYEASKALVSGLRLHGAIDARTDSHHQTERHLRPDFEDRHLQRPLLSIRRLSLVYNRGKFTAEVGRQFIRWGKADILNPTDRFAPRDFLEVVDNDFLAVPAARLTFESGATTIDTVWQARFVPSRTPLINQRWAVLPSVPQGIRFVDIGSLFPGGSAFGARLNHIGRGYDASISFYDGWNHLPLFASVFNNTTNEVFIQRYFPKLRTYGADLSVPLRWLTVKGEAAWFTSKTSTADEYILYVIQLERQTGEWIFVGGYAGETVTRERSALDFAPDRGLTRAFLGRAQYTIDVNRSVAFETAIRENLDGAWVRIEYSQAIGQHWRATAGFTLIRGEPNDFLGQYHRNSHGIVAIRYSF